MTIDYEEIGKQIRILRQKHGYSQEELAELCDISTSFMGHIERGTRKMSLETMVALSVALHTTPNALLQKEIPFDNTGFLAFINSLDFNTEEQKLSFFRAVRALAMGRMEL